MMDRLRELLGGSEQDAQDFLDAQVPDAGDGAVDAQPDSNGETVSPEGTSLETTATPSHSDEYFEREWNGIRLYRCPQCSRSARDRESATGPEQIEAHIRQYHKVPPPPTIQQRAEAIGLTLDKK